MANETKTETTWGSRNAEGMFKIATRLAGFDARELMLEIHRRQRGRDAKVNEATVLAAMHEVKQRFERREAEECAAAGLVGRNFR